jgi:phage terminase small subunit
MVCASGASRVSIMERNLKLVNRVPGKSGRFTHQERVFTARYAATGDATYAAEKAGYGSPTARAAQNMAKPELVAEITKLTRARIANELLPLAVGRHKAVLEDQTCTGQALNRAIELAYKYGLGDGAAVQNKEPHEMTAEELATAISALERVAGDRAKPVDQAPAAGVFE